MNITVLGSTRYRKDIIDYAIEMRDLGHAVETAFFDTESRTELEVAKLNRDIIERADKVCFFWDAQSMGVVFDMGMCFALRKKVKIVYENTRTFSNLFKQIEESGNE